MIAKTPVTPGARSAFADLFDFSHWLEWFASLDRGFAFLLLLPLVVAAVGLWAHFTGRDQDKE